MFYWGSIDGKEINMRAHRAAWRLFVGEIDKRNILCHKCNYPTCVNPDHLYSGTHKTNADDRERAGRTSRGPDHPTWKQTPELAAAIINEINSGKPLADVCLTLSIGWQTLYRMRDRFPEIAEVIKTTKSARYSAGARKR